MKVLDTSALACAKTCTCRDKAGFFFDMLDFGGRGEASYDEVAICISTVVGALPKVLYPIARLLVVKSYPAGRAASSQG